MDLNPERIQELSDEFNVFCQDRHEMGESQYGALTFLENDMSVMIMEELADVCNYARYAYIKIRLMQELISEVDDADSDHSSS